MDGDRPGARLIPRTQVRAAMLLALFGMGVAGLLAYLVDGGSESTRLDRAAERVVGTVLPMSDGPGRLLGEAVADLGSPPVAALALLTVAVLGYLRRGPRALALVLVGPPVAMVTTSTILKPIVGRTRGETLAYPSGHTTSSTSIALVVAILVLSSSLPTARRRQLVALLTTAVLAVCVSLVGRDYHYATDTVGAVGVALAVVLLAALAIDAMADSMAVAPDDVIGPDPNRLPRPAPRPPADPRSSAGPHSSGSLVGRPRDPGSTSQ